MNGIHHEKYTTLEVKSACRTPQTSKDNCKTDIQQYELNYIKRKIQKFLRNFYSYILIQVDNQLTRFDVEEFKDQITKLKSICAWKLHIINNFTKGDRNVFHSRVRPT